MVDPYTHWWNDPIGKVIKRQEAEIQITKKAILDLCQSPTKAKDLWEELELKGLSEDIGRACVWFLVDEGQATFTPDRRLVVRSE